MSNAMFHGSNLVVTGGTFTQVNDNRRTGKVSIERLQEAAAPAAFHDSGDRRDPPRCHPNTRVAVQEKIINWILGLDPETRNALIMWLHGPAGSGKSAIAQTIAEWAFQKKLLLTSYFFSRFDSTRNHERSLIATIAYQVTTNLPCARDAILAAIDADPLIFTRSLQTQTHSLIIKPLQDLIASGYFSEPTSMRLVIIDGLDECEDREGQLIILDAISTALQQYHMPLIFLIASRPEHDITHAFGAGYLGEKSTRLPLDHEYQPSSDIELFLRDKFLAITETHPFKAQILPNWPTEEVLQKLVLKSSGQFIYAATVVKFVRSTRHRPMDRLDIVIGLRPAARDLPFAELDVLYHHIFSSVDDIEPVLRILILFLLSRHRFGLDGFLTLHDIEEILGFSPGEIPVLICDLASVITIGQSPDRISSLYLLHASLDDFFFDKSRSKNLYIDRPLWHARFAHMFFQHVASSSDVKVSMSKLCYNIAGASPSVELRQEILDFDITKLLRPNSEVRNAAAYVLTHIKASRFDDATELHAHHVRSFDQYLREHLITYYSDPRLLSLVATIVDRMGYGHYLTNIAIHGRLFRFDHRLRIVDDNGLDLRNALVCSGVFGYPDFCAAAFVDQNRLGVYALDPEKYANVALYFLRYTGDHSMPHTPTRHSNLERLLRRTSPFKWRRRTIWKMFIFRGRWKLEKTLRDDYEQTSQVYENLDFNWEWVANVRRAQAGKAVRFGLMYLPLMLARAGRSDELISFARRHTFGPMSMAHPEPMKVAREAIEDYLNRMYSLDATCCSL